MKRAWGSIKVRGNSISIRYRTGPGNPQIEETLPRGSLWPTQ